MAHVVACEGYEVSPVRTGGESVIGDTSGDLFSVSAKGDGIITKVTKDMIQVEYEDPNIPNEHIFIGRKYGTVTGKTLPHDIVTDVTPGQNVFKGYVIAWNTGFFARDVMEEGGIVWKTGIPATVAYMDGPETIEDSCRVGPSISKKLTMNTSNIAEVTGSFEQSISNIRQLGEVVGSDDVLAYLEDGELGDKDFFSDFDFSSLDSLARLSPKAECYGTINKIEVIYNGDIEDATESVRDMILQADLDRNKDAKKYKDGRVRSGLASDLPIDTFTLRFYIDSTNDAADADKIVLGHQLKSVISSILEGTNVTEDGKEIDVLFAYQGVNDRIVLNSIYNGMLAPVTKAINKTVLQEVLEEL